MASLWPEMDISPTNGYITYNILGSMKHYQPVRRLLNMHGSGGTHPVKQIKINKFCLALVNFKVIWPIRW